MKSCNHKFQPSDNEIIMDHCNRACFKQLVVQWGMLALVLVVCGTGLEVFMAMLRGYLVGGVLVGVWKRVGWCQRVYCCLSSEAHNNNPYTLSQAYQMH